MIKRRQIAGVVAGFVVVAAVSTAFAFAPGSASGSPLSISPFGAAGGTEPAATVGVGDVAFFDANANGIQDAGDGFIGGAVVTVTDANGSVAGTATTDSNGSYLVTGLTPSTPYVVCFDLTAADGLPTGLSTADLLPAPTFAGPDPTTDSDIDATGCTSITSPSMGQDLTIDAGYVASQARPTPTPTPTPIPTLTPIPTPGPTTVSIGDLVFYDATGNGTQDAADPPIAGVTVTVQDNLGNVVASTTTDATGDHAVKI